MKTQIFFCALLLAMQIMTQPGLAQFGGQYRVIDLRNELLSKGANTTAIDTITVAWIRNYGSESALNEAYAIAVDASGNVYVTGGSEQSNTGIDYATIKYTASGKERWVARYNGPGGMRTVLIPLLLTVWAMCM